MLNYQQTRQVIPLINTKTILRPFFLNDLIKI
jgi:hypothetical protein